MCWFCLSQVPCSVYYVNMYTCGGEVGWGGGGIKVLPFSTMFPCSGVTSPGVDNNGVILLSVAASLILTDNFSSAPVYHSFLSWHGVECVPAGAQFGSVQVTLVQMKTYTIILREHSTSTDAEPERHSS